MSVLFIELLNGGGSSLLYLASILYWRSALAMVSTPMNRKSNKCCILLQSGLQHFKADTKDFCGVNIVFFLQVLAYFLSHTLDLYNGYTEIEEKELVNTTRGNIFQYCALYSFDYVLENLLHVIESMHIMPAITYKITFTEYGLDL